MSPEEAALLAVVRADPAADTPRLIYADWLDDAGRAERAEFIRCQVEAEQHHPDSARRAALEARAEQLFTEHWIDWWGEVCAAVGLPLPERSRTTRLGRLARRLTAGDSVGSPYRRAVYDRFELWGEDRPSPGLEALRRTAFESAGFRRGLPDRLAVYGNWPEAGDLLRRWAAVAPPAELHLVTPTFDWDQLEGPHLAGVGRLVLRDPGEEVPAVLASPHLTGLTDLRVETTDPPGPFAADLVLVAASPAAPRLQRLAVPVPDDPSAMILATADGFRHLTALEVELEEGPDVQTITDVPDENDRSRLEVLAGSPHLAGLTELSVQAALSAAGVRALVHRPTWAGLQKLTLRHLWDNDILDGLVGSTLPELTDLDLGDWPSPADFRALARLPCLRQLRHLHAHAPHEADDADVMAVAAAVDPDRIETLVLGMNGAAVAACRPELVRRFGDRVRFGERPA